MGRARTSRARFEEFAARDLADPAIQTAVVKAFEFTFEIAGKAIRGVVLEEGGDVALPCPSLAKGVELGLVAKDDEELWSGMARDRNLAAHIHLPDVAEELLPRLVNDYLPAATRLRERLAARIASVEPDRDA